MLTKLVSWSACALVVANLIPLIGVLLYDWNAAFVLALFWIENLIIGAFNVLKMLAVVIQTKRFGDVFVCGFFILHYGLFCTVHGLFLWDLLDLGGLDYRVYFPIIEFGLLELFAEGAAVLLGFLDQFGTPLLIGVVALALSHLVSFIENYILRGEILKQSVNDLMVKPYARILVLHAGLIVGAMVLARFGSPVWLLVIIVMFKIVLDLSQHQRRRTAYAGTEILNDR